MDTSHLGGWYNYLDIRSFCEPVVRKIIMDHNIKTAVDIGCGPGHLVKWLCDIGVNSIGVEGDCEAIKLSHCRDKILRHDYTLGPLVVDHRDAAFAFEFVEHVSEQHLRNFVVTMKCARIVALTHALPGQGGHHHVNERDDKYWVERMAMYDMTYLPEYSAELRAMASGSKFIRQSLMVFKVNKYATA